MKKNKLLSFFKKEKNQSTFNIRNVRMSKMVADSLNESLLKELSLNDSALNSFFTLMPNPLPILREMGWNKDVDAFNELLTDTQLSAVVGNRKAGVLAQLWDVYGSNQKEVEFIKTTLKALDINNLISKAIETPLFGRTTFGIVWDNSGDYWEPKKIYAIPHSHTKFSYNGELLISLDGMSFDKPDHPARFLNLVHNADLLNPYGDPVLAKCFWNVKFKKEGFKLWAIFMEKYGMPWLTGKYDPVKIGKDLGASNEEAASILMDMLSSMVRDGVVVAPNAVDIEMLKPESASSDIYSNIVRYCDEQTSKLLLGHSGSTESTSGDKLSNDTTATEVREHIIQMDRQYAVKLINNIIFWIHEFNFDGERPEFVMFKENEVDILLADRDAKLSPVLKDSGLSFSIKYFIDNYGLREEDLQNAPAPNNSNFGANLKKIFVKAKNEKFKDQELIDKAIDKSIDDKLFGKLTQIVTKYIEGQNDYQTVIENIAGVFPDMKSDELIDTFTRLMFAADLVGRFSEIEEAANE